MRGGHNARDSKPSGGRLREAEGEPRATARQTSARGEEGEEAGRRRKEEEGGAASANQNENPPQLEWWENI